MSRKNDVSDPMQIRLQTSHRLMSLPSLINANCWTLSRTTMTSTGRQIHSKCVMRCQMRSLTQEFSGSPWLQEQLRSLCRELIDIFSTSARSLPAQVVPMVIDVDRAKWEVPRNRLPPRHHSAEKQTAIRTQSKSCWS